jgi:hypothetical protein
VNEIQMIRAQLENERERTGAVAQACSAAAIEALHEAGLAYLRCVLGWFDERDERLRELYARRPIGERDSSLETLLAESRGGRQALDRLESASRGGRQEPWQVLSRFLAGPWKTRQEAIGRALASGLRVADWRTVAGIDADSMLEERRLYAQVRRHLPAGAATAGL